MSSANWNTTTLFGLALILSTLAAHGTEAPKAVPSSATACTHIAQVCALLADPAIRNSAGLAENAWDFNAPSSIAGFGPIAIKAERANMFTRTCAQRDQRVTTLIERHGDDQDVASEKLFQAYLTVMDARVACAEGRERDALALYDSIILIPAPARATQ